VFLGEVDVMPAFRFSLGKYRLAALTFVLIASLAGSVQAQGDEDDWHPESSFEGKFDWIQMTSGEWLKGEIIAMYDEELEFDSDEFDDFVLDWDDIKQIHSSQVMNVGFVGKQSAVGILIVDGDKVTVIGDETLEFERGEVLSITAGAPKEINFWSMKVFFGLVVREGNSDVREVNMQANFKRRTIRNRIGIDIIANENTTDDVLISDNQRASVIWDRFINQRFFVKPVFAEYLRDPFQNIGSRVTVGVGAGYQLVDSRKVGWEISGGPAYQETRFDDVAVGENEDESTPALVVGTSADWDITKWLEFDGNYRFQVVNEESGTYNHHLVISFESDITKLIDFDVSWIWDRIQDPRPSSDGTVPEQDDFKATVGLTFDF
jgi:putative salt-induced outer membrane protein YdiY